MHIQNFLKYFVCLAFMTFSSLVFAVEDDLQSAGQVTKILIVINKNEIAAAKLAATKSHNKMVKEYANMMKKDHTQNLEKTIKISKQLKIVPTSSSESTQLKEDGKKELDALENTAKDFDRMYIDNMVKDHESALDFLDQHINNTNTILQKHLQDTKKAVEQHLEKAKEIQKTLNS